MNTETTNAEGAMPAKVSAAPSAEFIHAISEFFETDPSDLLAELGYYQRELGPARDDLNSVK